MTTPGNDYPWDHPSSLDGSYAAQLVLLEAKLTAQGEEWLRDAGMTEKQRRKKKKKEKKQKQRAKEARVGEDEGGRVGCDSSSAGVAMGGADGRGGWPLPCDACITKNGGHIRQIAGRCGRGGRMAHSKAAAPAAAEAVALLCSITLYMD